MRISDWSSDVCSSDLLDDVKLVHKLALQKLKAKAKELEANWKWAKPMIEPDYGFTAEFARVYPQPVDVPAEVTVELERRSEERRGGKECVSACRSRWSQYH